VYTPASAKLPASIGMAVAQGTNVRCRIIGTIVIVNTKITMPITTSCQITDTTPESREARRH
jgi:hypothetical protein